jgi:lysophospholipase L1-like esterase
VRGESSPNRGAVSNAYLAWSRRSLHWAGLAAAVLLLVGAAAALWPTPTRVIVIGDSHVKGTQSQPRGPSFVEVLREGLGWRYEVVGAGCGGSTVRDWTHDGPTFNCSMRNAYPELGRPHLPAEIVVVLLGTNDAVGFGEPRPLDPQLYAQEMQELVRRVQHDGGQHILLLGPPPNPLARLLAPRRLRDYSEALAALAEQEPHVYMGPDLQQVVDLEEHFGGRTAHMNAAGHRLVGERLALAVRVLHASVGRNEAPEAR